MAGQSKSLTQRTLYGFSGWVPVRPFPVSSVWRHRQWPGFLALPGHGLRAFPSSGFLAWFGGARRGFRRSRRGRLGWVVPLKSCGGWGRFRVQSSGVAGSKSAVLDRLARPRSGFRGFGFSGRFGLLPARG